MSAPVLDPKTAFPIPVADADTQPFWDGVGAGELRIRRCALQRLALAAASDLLHLSGPAPVWTRVSGDGVIASWVVMRPPTLPAYADKTPFVVLLATRRRVVRLPATWSTSPRALKTDGTTEGVAIGRKVRSFSRPSRHPPTLLDPVLR
ncbi:MAG: hypothetical protein U0610_04285 [bacterium]